MGIMWNTLLIYSLAIIIAGLLLSLVIIVFFKFVEDPDNISDEEYLSDEVSYDFTKVTEYPDDYEEY